MHGSSHRQLRLFATLVDESENRTDSRPISQMQSFTGLHCAEAHRFSRLRRPCPERSNGRVGIIRQTRSGRDFPQ